ncbi:MAG: ABC transporter permease, partial [Bacillota bacterium]|nr:ABC transporter permease [Bacillota bacterium]
FAPISVKELFVGKMLASFVPVMALTIGSFLCFVLITDVLTYSMFDSPLLPNLNWILLIFWLSPIIAILTILFSVIVSAKVQSFQAAQQLGSLIVIPILLILVSQATGFLILQPYIVFIIGFALLILCFFLLKRITKFNNRNLLFEKQI